MHCRILYVVGQLGPGGLERQLYYLLQAMDRDRYRPGVAVWNFSKYDIYVPLIRELGITIYSLSEHASRLAKLKVLRKLTQQIQPEVIHSYSYFTNVAAWWAALGTNALAVGAVRSNFTNEKHSSGVLLGNLCARWPDAQIYNNFAAAQRVRNSQNPFAPRKVLVVRNGLDLQRFRKMPLCTNGRAHIVGVGSLLPVKRWDRLLNAATLLKQQGFDFDITIAGGGPLRESLVQQARNLRLIDQVSVVGHVDDIPGLLATSSFLAHTSDVEGCPNAVMEAMACGRAVVATDAGDIPSLIEDGRTGFIVQRGDDAKLIERLATLIANPNFCCEMGQAARAKAEREFGINRLVTETFAAYKAAGWRAADPTILFDGTNPVIGSEVEAPLSAEKHVPLGTAVRN